MRFYLKLGVVLLLAAALLQGLFWYAASRWFAQARLALAPIAELEYRGTFGWPNGRIGLDEVRVRPRATPGEEIVAERLVLDLGGPLSVLGLLFAAADQPPAEQVEARIQRLRFTLGLERSMRDTLNQLGFLAPFEAVGCNSVARFSGADYAELGWLQSSAEIDAQLRFTPSRQGIEARVGYDLAPLGRFDVDVVASGIEAHRLARTGAMPRIERLNVAFTDRGMMTRRNAYCARRLGLPVDGFMARHINAVREELEARGMFLDAPVLGTYQAFATRGGLLEFLATPDAGFALSEYKHAGWVDQLKMLNATLRHDRGSQVPITASAYAEGAGIDDGVPVAGDSVSVRISANAAIAFDPAELDEMVGERIRIRTVHGAIYVGTLLEMLGGLVRMEVQQGSASPRRIAINVRDVADAGLAE